MTTNATPHAGPEAGPVWETTFSTGPIWVTTVFVRVPLRTFKPNGVCPCS
jgi:hypothetical protein